MTQATAADARRIEQLVNQLADFGRVGPTAVTRLAFMPEDEAAHAFIAERMAERGLKTRFDAFGNLFGRRAGRQPDAPVVLTGSHLDGPPDGGMYDGTIGVICALEAIRLLDERGVETERPIEVAAIRCEHLDRFGVSCLGSRAMAGKLTEDDLDRLTDGLTESRRGQTLREALREAGHLREALASADIGERVHAFVELHIEQGKVLEERGERLGLVTGIAGPTRFAIELTGAADHSGGTPMDLRRDALCGAAEMILALERMASETSSSVGTVGVIEVSPGAVHTIPGSVRFKVDIRGVDRDEKAGLVDGFRRELDAIAARRELGMSVSTSVDEPPVPCSAEVLDTMAGVLEEAGFRFMRMPSGGGHDTQHLAARTNVAMLFVPSVGGISHTPEEYTSPEDLAHGAEALALCLQQLAGPASADGEGVS